MRDGSHRLGALAQRLAGKACDAVLGRDILDHRARGGNRAAAGDGGKDVALALAVLCHTGRVDADEALAALGAVRPLEEVHLAADAGELAKAGEKLLSAKGSMTVDKRTNRLLLRDNKTALSTLEQWVSQMDLPVGQVELSAHIVTINEKSLRELGVKWTLADAQQAGGVGQVTTLGSDLSVATATTHIGFNIGRINGRLLDLELSALEQKQQLDIIASPRLLASHLQPASIKQGSEIPYQVSSGESGATSVEFKGDGSHAHGVTKRSHPAEITHQPERSGAGATAGRWRSAGD